MNAIAKLVSLFRGLDVNRPIGNLGSVDGWKTLPIKPRHERLVPLGSFSDYPQIATSSIYKGERDDSPYPLSSLRGSLFTVFVREGVAKKLAKAAKLLPKGHMLLVWDAFRPLAVQQSLFDSFVKILEGRGTPHDQAIVDAQKFVSIPSKDPTRPSPHNTGGAVDLTIIRFPGGAREEMEHLNKIVAMKETPDNWREIYEAEMRRIQIIRQVGAPLDMGTVFDKVCSETDTMYYETLPSEELDAKAIERRDNRRLLWNVLSAVGFSNYPAEWWHFDFGNQFDSARTGRTAIYGAIELSAENYEHESIRSGHYAGCRALLVEPVSQGVTKYALHSDPLRDFVKQIAQNTGDLRLTQHPTGAPL